MGNAVLAEEKHQPLYQEIVDGYKVKYIAGGATQNTIRVAQWMSQTAGATSYIGSVGKDSYSKQLKDCATADGVAVHYMEDEKTPTGTCAALIMDKERSLVANLSAANNYKKEHFDSEEIQKVVSATGIVYCAGFFLTVSPPTIMAAGAHCAENNKVFCMNLSAEFITQFFTDPLMAAIPFVDIMFGNETEAKAFGEKQGYADKSVKNVALEISKMDKTNKGRSRMVVFTQGSESTVVAQDGKVTEFAVPKLAPEDIVDVNGAGDSFVGGFLASLSKGKSLQQCVDAGHYAASVILKVSGCVLEGKPDAKFL